MKSILKTFTLSLLLLAFVAPTFAQKKKKDIDQAHVKYTMTAEGGMAAALTGSTIDLFFTPTHAKILGDVMSGMIKMDVRFDNKDKKGMMLMDMMGQKKFVEMDDKAVEETKKTNQKPPQVEYTKNYKKIAGYKCQQAKMMIEGLAEPIIVYITEKIKPSNLGDLSMMKFTGLKGFPLSWEMEQEGMKIKIEATTISLDKLPKKIFSMVIPDGYEKMTMEDLQNMGGTLGM
ncbi:hypothetical protein [Aureispira anguillae]|uniref:DUF4412 domain-containing protein n=1 Tax=Aureispira anguillae TaxID=2864201 RepID=A0A915VMT5_9BACT|nr:hypothetical protein [Aureispira anguillae]BDS09744.1 hypothetical protein AsAng_0004490 [Aureispira anguillae]